MYEICLYESLYNYPGCIIVYYSRSDFKGSITDSYCIFDWGDTFK
jgi:hypothetical protein